MKEQQLKDVPLHPQILEQGFLGAINDLQGPLFYDPTLRRGGPDSNTQAKKVGESLAAWVRSLGISGPVQPNHGWRHRFKSEARKAQMDPEVRDVIQGHSPRTVGETYGEISLDVKSRAINKLPRFQISGSN